MKHTIALLLMLLIGIQVAHLTHHITASDEELENHLHGQQNLATP